MLIPRTTELQNSSWLGAFSYHWSNLIWPNMQRRTSQLPCHCPDLTRSSKFCSPRSSNKLGFEIWVRTSDNAGPTWRWRRKPSTCSITWHRLVKRHAPASLGLLNQFVKIRRSLSTIKHANWSNCRDTFQRVVSQQVWCSVIGPHFLEMKNQRKSISLK